MSEQLNEAMQVLDFLAGTGELEGCGFGDKPAGVQGNYWWRRHLPKIRYALSTHHAAPGALQQEASGDNSFPFYELRFIMRVLSHKGDAPKEDWDTAYGMARKVFQAWHESSRAAATAPAGGVLSDQEIADLGPGEVTVWAYEDIFSFGRAVESAVIAKTGVPAVAVMDALRDARSVISSINASAGHRVTVGEERCYWQREEWVRWALDEVLPRVNAALTPAARAAEPEATDEMIDAACAAVPGLLRVDAMRAIEAALAASPPTGTSKEGGDAC